MGTACEVPGLLKHPVTDKTNKQTAPPWAGVRLRWNTDLVLVLGLCLVTQRWGLGKGERKKEIDERGEEGNGRGKGEGRKRKWRKRRVRRGMGRGREKEGKERRDSPSNLRLKAPSF